MSAQHISVPRLPARLRTLRAKMILGVDRIICDLDRMERGRLYEAKFKIYSDGRVEVQASHQMPTISDADMPAMTD